MLPPLFVEDGSVLVNQMKQLEQHIETLDEWRFRFGAVQGCGAYTTVRKVYDKTRKAWVAAKVYDKATLKCSQASQKGFLREYATLLTLAHPSIIRMLGVYQDARSIYLMLELMEGGDLIGFLEQKDTCDETEAREIFEQVVSALYHAESCGFLHRDIKLENILLEKSRTRIVLADWGFSCKLTAQRTLTETCGSLHYAAPELYVGAPYDGSKAQSWSLGVLLYTLCAGTLPFMSSGTIVDLANLIKNCQYEVPSSFSDNLVNLISHLLQTSPNKRLSLSEIMSHPWMTGSSSKAKLDVDKMRMSLLLHKSFNGMPTEEVDSTPITATLTPRHKKSSEGPTAVVCETVDDIDICPSPRKKPCTFAAGPNSNLPYVLTCVA